MLFNHSKYVILTFRKQTNFVLNGNFTGINVGFEVKYKGKIKSKFKKRKFRNNLLLHTQKNGPVQLNEQSLVGKKVRLFEAKERLFQLN